MLGEFRIASAAAVVEDPRIAAVAIDRGSES